MKILVLNCGSSSIKYQVFEMPAGRVLAKGLVQRIGEAEGEIEQSTDAGKEKRKLPIKDHADGLHLAIELLSKGERPPVHDVAEIAAVGHRVVHGGERFTETVEIDAAVVKALEDHVVLAPLHNPTNLLGISVAQKVLPHAVQVGVFDTAFHQTMPPKAYRYAIPAALYKEQRIRRYGFHGTSHRYVAARACELLGKAPDATNLITCHLGNGCSIAAIAGGKSVDTSMGLTPLEGLVMGTRSGDLDPAVVFHLARVKNMSLDDVDNLLNKKSGLLGLSGKSNDVRELLRLRDAGDADAALALEIFSYRIKKYIGAYSAALGRVDAVVFTAGIGENSPVVREMSTAGLEMFGVRVDAEKNAEAVGKELDVSAPDARVRVLVVPTNEEKLIAMDTYALAK